MVSLARGTDGPGQQASLPHRSDGTLRSKVYGMCARRTNRHDSLSSEYSIACDYGISAQAPRSKLCLAKPVIRWHCCIDDEEVTATGKHRGGKPATRSSASSSPISQPTLMHFIPSKQAQTPLLSPDQECPYPSCTVRLGSVHDEWPTLLQESRPQEVNNKISGEEDGRGEGGERGGGVRA